MILETLSGKTIEYRYLAEKDVYTLSQSIVLRDEETGRIYGVPPGFECDGASVPWFLPETGACEAAGFVHDFAYRFGVIYQWKDDRWQLCPVTRAAADELYRATCRAYGGNRAWAGTQWGFLRAWPGTMLIWARHRRRNRVWTGMTPSTVYLTQGAA